MGRSIEQLLDPLSSFRFPVLWVKPQHKKVYIAFCGYSRRPFTLSTDLFHPLIIRDLFVDADRGLCEEARRCLNTDCPLNKTTQERFMKSIGGKNWSKEWRKMWKNAQSYKDATLTDLGFPEYETFKEPGILEKMVKKRVRRAV